MRTRFREVYYERLREEIEGPGPRKGVLPGVRGLLSTLSGRDDLFLGLLTGNVATGAELKLRSGAIDPRRFRVGAFGSDHAVRSELPAIAAGRAESLFGRRPQGEEIVIIGDTPSDMICGLAVGARSIGVATGAYSAAELSRAGAYAAFDDLSDQNAVWQAISA